MHTLIIRALPYINVNLLLGLILPPPLSGFCFELWPFDCLLWYIHLFFSACLWAMNSASFRRVCSRCCLWRAILDSFSSLAWLFWSFSCFLSLVLVVSLLSTSVLVVARSVAIPTSYLSLFKPEYWLLILFPSPFILEDWFGGVNLMFEYLVSMFIVARSKLYIELGLCFIGSFVHVSSSKVNDYFGNRPRQ